VDTRSAIVLVPQPAALGRVNRISLLNLFSRDAPCDQSACHYLVRTWGTAALAGVDDPYVAENSSDPPWNFDHLKWLMEAPPDTPLQFSAFAEQVLKPPSSVYYGFRRKTIS
jgi:hypothetical protein